MIRLTLSVMLSILLFVSTTVAERRAPETGDRRKKVLVLHAYHQGLQWTDQITQGIQEIFRPYERNLEIYYEYLDTKRNYGQNYLDKLYAMHAAKLAKTRFSVIIAADNNALTFALTHGRSLYGEVPVVFCGINNYSPAIHANRTDVTGVVERTDFRGTIELMRRLHPQRNHIWLVVDRTVTGDAIVTELSLVLTRFAQDVTFTFYRDFLLEDVPRDLKRLGEKDLIYLLTFNRDAADQFISYTEGIEMIRRSVQVPVYGSWDFYLGKGIMGGMITAGAEQGRRAARMALNILEGRHPSAIPVDTVSTVVPMFDYRELHRFHVDPDRLPAGAVILHRPPGLIERYRKHALRVLMVAMALMGLLLWRLGRLRRQQRELAKTNTLLDQRVRERTEALELEKARLDETLAQVKTLRGLLPICAACKKIRDDSGYWKQIEAYISEHSDAKFSHGVCPECARRLYPELDLPLENPK